MCLPRFALIYNVLKPSAAVSQSFIIKRKSESCVAPPVCFSRAKSVEPVTSPMNINNIACVHSSSAAEKWAGNNHRSDQAEIRLPACERSGRDS